MSDHDLLSQLRQRGVDALVSDLGLHPLRDTTQIYRLYFDAIGEAAFTLDAAGHLLAVNRCFARWIGRAIEQLRGALATDYVLPTDRHAFAECLQRADGASRAIHLVGEDGVIAVQLTVTRLAVSAEASVLCCVASRRMASHAPAEGDARLPQLARHVPGVVYQYQWFPDGRSCFPYASEGIWSVYEVLPEQVRHSADPVFSRLHPDDLGRVTETIIASRDRLTVWECTYRVRLPQRGERWLEGRATPERLSDGSTLWHGYIRDVTDDQRKEREIADREALYRGLVDALPHPVYRTDLAGRLVFANRALAEWLGSEPLQLAGKPVGQLYPRSLAARYEEEDRQLLQSAGIAHSRRVHCRPGSRTETMVEVIRVPVREGQRVVGLQGMFWDVADDERRREETVLSATVFESAQTAILILDPQRRILRGNAGFRRLLGEGSVARLGDGSDAALGSVPALCALDDAGDRRPAELAWARADAAGNWAGELGLVLDGSPPVPVHASLSAVRGDTDAITHYVLILTDISERHRAEQRVEYLATHDALTGLANRVALGAELDRLLADRSENACGAVFFIDLDRFKHINDVYGHSVGDAVIRTAAERLGDAIGPGALLCRQGGDEFIAVVPGADADTVKHLCERILAAFEPPMMVGERSIAISTSVGVTCYPADSRNAEQLLAYADLAMYAAKNDGRGGYRLFNAALDRSAHHSARIERELREAIRAEALSLALHPQLDTRTGTICGLEALARWHHPERGVIGPGEFIPVAEESGLIVPMGYQILRSACLARKLLKAVLPDHLPVAVNVSPIQFRQPDFLDQVYRILEEARLPGSAIELEITEQTLVTDVDRAAQVIARLQQLGIAISIDDFGTGFSNLSLLQRFEVNRLKLDMSFVHQITQGDRGRQICEAVVRMGHSMGMRVVAEGVETEAQHAALQAIGCDEVQGFLFAKPMALDALITWLRPPIRAGRAPP